MGRIDWSPPLSRFLDVKGKGVDRQKHEEYYPKSRTGLSGLSLSAAGSSSVWRKDLAQTFAPLIVDPNTLTAVVNASVRVPEDIFPTITNVPGEMISFKYYVEVVVDLGGKLAGQQRQLPRVGGIALSSSFGSPGGIIDTAHIRREKRVGACLFGVTVGSMDSSRRPGPSSAIQEHSNDWPDEAVKISATIKDPIHEEPHYQGDIDGQHTDEHYPHHYNHPLNDTQYPERYPPEGYGYQHYDDSYHHFHPPPAHHEIPVPQPEVRDAEGLSEKETIRRAEERLLPSQPPGAEEPSTPSGIAPTEYPSAPRVPPDEQEDDLYGSEDATPRGATAPNGSLEHDGSSVVPPIPTAPALEDLEPGVHASDDKQELERQRMFAEASAPPDFQEEDNGGEGSSGVPHEPSAPILTEEDEYGGQFSHHAGGSSHGESLPKYER